MNNINQNNFVEELNKFAANYQGDPKTEVQNLLNSGKMSQQTYSRLNQMANAIQNGNMMQAIASMFGR
jgi:TATA-box binding protein (TBP) (component of TFIID and TFIIIB)